MRIVLLGGGGTGKSSYAVGLYAGLSYGAFTAVELRGVHDPVGFLNDGIQRLSARQSVGRTDYESAETVEMTVASSDGREHRLSIPDRSGEAFRSTLNAREWDAGLASDLADVEGILLFANPMDIDPGGGTKKVFELVGDDDDDDPEDKVPIPWSPKMTPTDVRMVDVLQEMRELVEDRVLPVAVVVSAWDVVDTETWTPPAWLEERLGLVAQFLESNAELYPAMTFGVSVQGSVFKEDEVPGQDEPDPWERAWAHGPDGEAVELCEPLLWLLDRTGGSGMENA